MPSLYLSAEAVGWVAVVQDGLALTSNFSMRDGLLGEGHILRVEVICILGSLLCVCACACECECECACVSVCVCVCACVCVHT